jgi:hypothetical protein
VTGQVRNDSGRVILYPGIQITLFDANGKILDVVHQDFTLPSTPPSIDIDQEVNFEIISLYPVPTQVTYYRLQTYGR